MRAVASLREHGDLPEIEAPQVIVIRVSGISHDSFQANVGQALAVAQTGDASRLTPQELAVQVAEYLAEVVTLVPAYREIATVSSSVNGDIVIALHPHKMR